MAPENDIFQMIFSAASTYILLRKITGLFTINVYSISKYHMVFSQSTYIVFRNITRLFTFSAIPSSPLVTTNRTFVMLGLDPSISTGDAAYSVQSWRTYHRYFR